MNELQLAILVFLFLTGLTVGSFLNVVIYRLPREESIVHPRSRCPHCQFPIPWFRNFPLLSFILQRGKCAHCQGKISRRYPLVELITGILFVATAIHFPIWYAWPFQFYFMGALVACTFIDLDHWILPDKITLPGIIVGFLSSLVIPGFSVIDSLAGILFGGGVLYLVAWAYQAIAKKDGLGGGDIKFLAMVGAFIGLQGAAITLVLASFIGSLVGLFLILGRGRKAGSAIPFGPFLSFAAGLAFFFGPAIWRWYFHLQ